MKKTLLPLFTLCIGLGANAQVLNGDFEDWDKLILFQQPNMGIEAVSSNYETFFETGQLNVNQVPNGDGSALRLENIGQGENVMPAYFLTGETPNQEGEALVFGGGIPVEDSNVSGISMDLRYDIPAEVPGFVIVQFKLNDVPVGPGNMGPGTFYFPLSGTQEWENEVFDFGGAINTEIDQVVIGIACSDLINEDATFPEDAWLEADNLTFVNSTDEITNGDFDIWSFVPPIFTPTSVDVDIRPFDRQFFRTDDVSEGVYALGLETLDFDGFVAPGRALMGIRSPEGDIIPTIDLNDEHTMISFDYKYQAEGDVAEAVIVFFELQNDDLVPAFVKTIDLQPNQEFQSVEYSFTEDLEENFVDASKVAIEFTSSKIDAEPQSGSKLILDNVEVSGTLSTFDWVRSAGGPQISAYPNPTLARVIFDFGAERTGYYRVYNAQGFQIDFVNFQNTDRLIHNLYGMPAGQYVFRFYHDSGVETVRVNKL